MIQYAFSSFNDRIVQCYGNYENFLGYSLFEYADEQGKGSANGENNYGKVTESGSIKNTYSAITDFQSSDGFQNVIKPNL